MPGRINRVFLVSDGGANLGVTDAEIIGEHAGAHDEDGIYMVGVGVGEAGGSPPSHSMIADMYPPEQRATAMAIFALGVNVGILIGFLVGGWVNGHSGSTVATRRG